MLLSPTGASIEQVLSDAKLPAELLKKLEEKDCASVFWLANATKDDLSKLMVVGHVLKLQAYIKRNKDMWEKGWQPLADGNPERMLRALRLDRHLSKFMELGVDLCVLHVSSVAELEELFGNKKDVARFKQWQAAPPQAAVLQSLWPVSKVPQPSKDSYPTLKQVVDDLNWQQFETGLMQQAIDTVGLLVELDDATLLNLLSNQPGALRRWRYWTTRRVAWLDQLKES